MRKSFLCGRFPTGADEPVCCCADLPEFYLPPLSVVMAAVATRAGLKRKLYTLVLLAERKDASMSAAATCSSPVPVSPVPMSLSALTASASPPAPAWHATSPYSRLLLGLKKRGFGAGKWNGFGGKVELGETMPQGALREMREESGLELDAACLSKRAVILQEFEGDPLLLEVHVYFSSLSRDECSKAAPVESDEMKPQWWDLASIPFSSMWADDTHWYPLLLSEHFPRFQAHFLFRGQEELLSHSITEMNAEQVKEMELADSVPRTE
jgi:8-oxo-dGTP diphosphatase/2-hydroxy-dATP diphosphatase